MLPLLVAALIFVAGSLRWPLIGDASQIHYICFLMAHGVAPYRTAGDMNMPGALLLESTVMHTLGPGAFAWRGFDLLLLLVAMGSMAVIAGRGRRLVGIGAGLLLLLLHGADGVNDLGERDLSIASLLLVAVAALVVLGRRRADASLARWEPKESWISALAGAALGEAATIKPTVLPLAAVLFFLLWRDGRAGQRRARWLLPAGAGFLLPCAAALALLLRERALGAFLHDLHTLVPFYAGLDHRPPGYLLLHGVAPLLPVAVVWTLAAAWTYPLRGERLLLAIGAVFGLVSYLLQAKGFPYYRYPLLAFLLPLMALDFASTLRRRGPGRLRALQAGLAVVALCYAAWWLGPLSAWKAHRFHWRDQQFVHALSADLRTLRASDRQVQCIDSISGCGTALLRLHLVQSTGVLSDFFLFGPDKAAAVRETRAQFQQAVQLAPPRIVIVTDGLHLDPKDPGRWTKLATWPWFEQWLAQQYTLVLVRRPTRPVLWWSRAGWPAAYRVYVLRGAAAAARGALVTANRPGSSASTDIPLQLPEP